jgi:hypothetical protein
MGRLNDRCVYFCISSWLTSAARLCFGSPLSRRRQSHGGMNEPLQSPRYWYFWLRSQRQHKRGNTGHRRGPSPRAPASDSNPRLRASRPQASGCTVGAPISARKRDSAHVPYREADCFALCHSYGGSGKRRRARKYAKQLTGVNRVGPVSQFVRGKATGPDCPPDRRPGDTYSSCRAAERVH